MTTLIKLSTISLFFLTSSCFFDGFTGIKGNEDVQTQNRTITSNFNAIKVQQGITVYLTQGDETSLKVEADDNIIDLLKTEVKNNELKIYFEKNVYRAKARNVYLTTANISKINSSSGSEVKSENTIKTDDLTLDSSSGSSIQLTVNSNSIDCGTSSGASMHLKGTTSNFIASSSSGSSINAKKLEAENVTAKTSSGASMDIYVNGKLNAHASSGGSIDYYGKPTEINKDTSSGGSVNGN